MHDRFLRLINADDRELVRVVATPFLRRGPRRQLIQPGQSTGTGARPASEGGASGGGVVEGRTLNALGQPAVEQMPPGYSPPGTLPPPGGIGYY
jgi:hypothetical protein